MGGTDSMMQSREGREGVTQAGERWRDQTTTGQVQRSTPVNSETMQQLNRDALTRQEGAARERSFNRGAGSGTGISAGGGMGRLGRRR